MPIAIFEAITAHPDLNALGITPATVFEAESLNADNRPNVDAHFVTVRFLEQTISAVVRRGPRAMEVAVHVDWTLTRDYTGINRILNRVDAVLVPFEQVTGSDGIRVACIRPMGRSRNLTDPGWRTISRYATYSVLTDESAT